MTELTFVPLTPDRWDDLEDLFGPERGANSGCWCMLWRTTRTSWETMGRAGRKAAFRDVVDAGTPTGILAYEGDRAVGWCAVGPRATLPSLDRSRVARRVDELPVWAINCFYVRTGYRGGGMMQALIEAAVAWAADQGAPAVEACPLDVRKRAGWGDAFVGIASAFRDCGFVEIARRSPNRPLMRRVLRT